MSGIEVARAVLNLLHFSHTLYLMWLSVLPGVRIWGMGWHTCNARIYTDTGGSWLLGQLTTWKDLSQTGSAPLSQYNTFHFVDAEPPSKVVTQLLFLKVSVGSCHWSSSSLWQSPKWQRMRAKYFAEITFIIHHWFPTQWNKNPSLKAWEVLTVPSSPKYKLCHHPKCFLFHT